LADSPSLPMEELLDKLKDEVARWEDSPYYVRDQELFDLEQFLLDYQAHPLKEELEERYGVPLNTQFWTSSLNYHRLKRAREPIKKQENEQEQKRQQYLEAQLRQQTAWLQWIKELTSATRRSRLRLEKGGKHKDSKE